MNINEIKAKCDEIRKYSFHYPISGSQYVKASEFLLSELSRKDAEIATLTERAEQAERERDRAAEDVKELLCKYERSEQIDPCDYCKSFELSEEECGCDMGDNWRYKGDIRQTVWFDLKQQL